MKTRIAIYCVMLVLFSIIVTAIHTSDDGYAFESCPICRNAANLSSSVPIYLPDLQQVWTVTSCLLEVTLHLPCISHECDFARPPPA